MKRKILNGVILCSLLSLAVANGVPVSAESTAKPWPTHAPEATPFVHTQAMAEQAVPEIEPTQYESYEDFLRSIYTEYNSFYSKDWELEMFRELPQEEPFSFVPHSLRFSLDKGEAMRLARLFSEQEGCAVRVKAMYQLVDGRDDWSYLPIVTMTPERLFALSAELDEPLFIEQLYDAVEERFDQVYWDGAPLTEEQYLNLAYEQVGGFCFRDEELEYFRETLQDQPMFFQVTPPDGSNWKSESAALEAMARLSAEAGDALSLYQNGTKDEFALSLKLTPPEMFALAERVEGPWLIHYPDEWLMARLAPEVSVG